MMALRCFLATVLVLAALVFLVRAAFVRRRAAILKLCALAGAAGLCAWMVRDGTFPVGQRVAVVHTEQGDLAPVWQLLHEAGCRQTALFRVDETASPEAAPATWHDGPIAPEAATRLPDIDQAIKAALAALHEPPWGWLDHLLRSKRRLVITVGDRERWSRWLPIEVQERLEEARRAGVTIDLVETQATPDLATLEISSELDLPAHGTLAESRTLLRVVVSGPVLQALAGQPVSGSYQGQLNVQQATLASQDLPANLTVHDDGTVEWEVRLASFVVQDGQPATLPPHFALVEMKATLTVGDRTLEAAGQAWLPVRSTTVVIACGKGHPVAGLRGGRWTSVPGQPFESDDVQTRLAAVLGSARARNAVYEYIPVALLARRLRGGAAMPDVLVLNELSPDDWARPGFTRALRERVRGGLSLVVIDPPMLPTDPALEAELSRLLPAVSAPGPAEDKDLPATIDRSPALLLVFDYNALWASPHAPVATAFSAQLETARALIDRYKSAGLLAGELEAVEAIPGDESTRVIRYRPGADDKILVCVAPKVSAHRGSSPCDPTLANHLLPSQADLRLATLFPHWLSDRERARAGLKREDAPAELKGILDASPSALPNMAVVIFTARGAPQDAPGTLNPQTHLKIVLSHNDSDPRTLAAVPAGMVSRLLARGVHVAPFLLAVPPPSPTLPGYEHGLRDLTTHWPVNEPNLFTHFTLRPADLFGRLAARGVEAAFTQARPLDRQRALAGLVPPVEIPASSGTAADIAPLYQRWQRLHGAPRHSFFGVFTILGRAIDERFAPHCPWAQANSVPMAEHRAGPRRSRVLVESPRFPARQRVTHVAGVTPQGALPLTDKHTPLLVGGRAGAGHVFVMAYSPLEMPPNGADWPAQDVIDRGDGATVDPFGVSRLIDIATFVGRVRITPPEQPSVRSLRIADVRGGLCVEADFLPAQLEHPQVLEPVLRAGERTAHLALAGLDWNRGVLSFTAGPAELGKLFEPGAESARVVIDFVPGQPGTAFFCRPPVARDWGELSSLESVALLSAFTGGQWLGHEEALTRPRIAVRLWAILGLGVLVALAAAARWRFRRRLRSREQVEAARLTELDTVALADDLGKHVHERTVARMSEREVVRLGPFRGDGDLESILNNDLVAYVFDQPSVLTTRFRPVERTARTVIVVNLGRSMRLGLGGVEPKGTLAGLAAALIGAVAAGAGGTLHVLIGGTEGEPWHDDVPWNGRPGAGEVEGLVAAGLARKPAVLAKADSLDVPPGANVFWISDFHEELLPQQAEVWSRWATGVLADGGRLAAVCLSSESERTLTGWTADALQAGSLDRSSLTEADLEAKLAEHAQRVADLCERSGAELVRLDTMMTADAIVEAFAECEILA